MIIRTIEYGLHCIAAHITAPHIWFFMSSIRATIAGCGLVRLIRKNADISKLSESTTPHSVIISLDKINPRVNVFPFRRLRSLVDDVSLVCVVLC